MLKIEQRFLGETPQASNDIEVKEPQKEEVPLFTTRKCIIEDEDIKPPCEDDLVIDDLDEEFSEMPKSQP